jgi:hypothetical protein
MMQLETHQVLSMWEFGDPVSGALNTSTLASPTHTYADTGTYTIKLKVSLSGGMCSDSTTLKLKVYPGFFPVLFTMEVVLQIPISLRILLKLLMVPFPLGAGILETFLPWQIHPIFLILNGLILRRVQKQ